MSNFDLPIPNTPSEGSLAAGGLGGAMPVSGESERRDAVLINNQIKKGNKEFSAELGGFTRLLKSASRALSDLTAASKTKGTGDGDGPQNAATNTANYINNTVRASNNTAKASKPPASAAALGGGGGTFANFRGGFVSAAGGAAGMAGSAVQMGSQIMGALDRRVDSAYGRMLQTDRLGVLMQQTQGISQQQYYNQMRLPLQGYRLGQGGITELLALQASTGINAARQAGSVQGLRAATGYSYSTQDFAQMLRTLASPQVSNRMTVTMGMGLYGPGGQQRSMMDVMQGVVSRTGLTNERVLRGALQPGSVTRARLTAMGIPEDMHDMILQYAQSNNQFQRVSGGRMGMYNPESAAQRRMMGIEGNFATEREETTRLGETREEKFYNRQKDNMAALERNTQAMIKLSTILEEQLSGAIGARISTRGNPLMRLARGVGGLGLMVASPFLASTGVGALGAGAAFGLGASMFTGAVQGGPTGGGDPTEHIKKKDTPVGANRKQTSAPSGLHATFRERLEAMMADNPNVKVGGGFRSSAQQRQLFLSRYTRTNDKTGVFWGGSYWKKNSGVADAAPPGMSMHEIGLAADLTGDLDWVQKNAHRYGLKTFADVNDEPWHVQPAELPNSRRQYEKEGAIWGTIPGAETFDPNSFFEGETSSGGVADALYKSSGASSIPTFSQMSIADQMAAQKAMNVLGQGGGGVLQSLGSLSSSRTPNGQSSGKSIRTGKAMDPREIAQLLLRRKFAPEDIWKMLAISWRESNWIPGVRNVGPVDDSYGLFQINMKGNLGPGRRAQYGLKEDSELFDPKMNVKAARLLYGGGNLSHWNVGGDWKNGISADKIEESKAIAKSMNLPTTGDPTAPTRGGGGTTIIEGGGVTIAPNIYIQSAGNNTADAHRAAVEISKLVTHDIKMSVLRSM
jgi:hypothetical protein